MKIITKRLSYEKVSALKPYTHTKPWKQWWLLRFLVGLLSFYDLWKTDFHYEMKNMDRLEKDQPCLILMNHSSFLDLEIVGRIFRKRRYSIVCTMDAFIGLHWILKLLGTIPTRKFTVDASLIKDMIYCLKELKSSVIMFPEASYSFDGTATPLPDSLGKCLKLLNVPVVVVQTKGVFLHNPLYNGLQKRKVPTQATVAYLLSPEEIREKSVEELNQIIREQFSFDHFKWQKEHNIRIAEPFRADYLNRVLYKCPSCLAEGKMLGQGISLKCNACSKEYELDELGYLRAKDGKTEIDHIPDWYRWERECVRNEILKGSYHMDVPVEIAMMVDTKCIYQVGNGTLKHTAEGFALNGCDGKLKYHQPASASYSLYSDFYWYEIGDVICIGDTKAQYYCFPQNSGDIVAKARLAAEELYRIQEEQRKAKAATKKKVNQ